MSDDQAWQEEYDESEIKTDEEMKAWCSDTLKVFNTYRRSKEKRRILVNVNPCNRYKAETESFFSG